MRRVFGCGSDWLRTGALVAASVLASVLALVLGPAVDLVSGCRQLSPWKKITAGKFL